MDYLRITGRLTVINVGLALGAAKAQAGCAIEQTAANEIVIKTSVGGCNTAALRSRLSGALSGPMPGAAAAGQAHTLADVKRTAAQGALWRLANVHNQPVTSLSMPGGR